MSEIIIFVIYNNHRITNCKSFLAGKRFRALMIKDRQTEADYDIKRSTVRGDIDESR